MITCISHHHWTRLFMPLGHHRQLVALQISIGKYDGFGLSEFCTDEMDYDSMLALDTSEHCILAFMNSILFTVFYCLPLFITPIYSILIQTRSNRFKYLHLLMHHQLGQGVHRNGVLGLGRGQQKVHTILFLHESDCTFRNYYKFIISYRRKTYLQV